MRAALSPHPFEDSSRAMLARLAEIDPGVRWIARLEPGRATARADRSARYAIACRWPDDLRLPPVVLPLARRALLSGRVTRVAVPGEPDELLAVPAVAGTTVTLCGVHALEPRRRAALVRAIRDGAGEAVGNERVTPGRSVKPPTLPPTPTPTPTPTPQPQPQPQPTPTPTPTPTRENESGPAPRPSVPTGELERAALAAVLAHGDVESVALAAADAATGLFGCRRVSIGVERRGRGRLLAISGEARPDGRREPVRRLLGVVDEVLRRDVGDQWPSAGAGAAPPGEAHRLAHLAGNGMPLLSALNRSPRGARAVAVLERAAERPFVAGERASLELALAPVLALIGRLERGGVGRLERWHEELRAACAVRRVGRPSRRGIVLAALAMTLVGALAVPLPYRVGARVIIEASDRQVLVAPHAGHVRSARARAGDTVAAGEVLATLDERDLLLARDKWRGEASKNRAEQSQALARHDRVELARLRADAARLAAELALVEERRARGVLRAPFAGVVIAGDPTRSLGAPVAAGDVLFEVARGERRSPLIEIDERDIAVIESGAAVRVRMAASPRTVREARLDALVPVAVVENGRSVFRVPATFVDGADEALSPGMQGVARIDAGRRPLANAWTRAVRERLLLLGWSLGLVR